MIIECGKRRLVSHRYGWKIEIKHQSEKTGAVTWLEDRPAHPANLEQALEAVCERVLRDNGDCSINDLPERLREATQAVRKYMRQARRAA